MRPSPPHSAGSAAGARAKARRPLSDYSWADEGATIVVSLPVPESVDDGALLVSHDEAALRVEIEDADAVRVLALPTPHGPFFRGITGVTTKRTRGVLRLRIAQLIDNVEIVRR